MIMLTAMKKFHLGKMTMYIFDSYELNRRILHYSFFTNIYSVYEILLSECGMEDSLLVPGNFPSCLQLNSWFLLLRSTLVENSLRARTCLRPWSQPSVLQKM